MNVVVVWYGMYHFANLISLGTALLRPMPRAGVLIGIVGSIDALARGLAIDLAPIRVNAICPGAVDTEVSSSSLRMLQELCLRPP